MPIYSEMEVIETQMSQSGGCFAAVVLALDGEEDGERRSGCTRLLAGRPLVGWALRSALLSGEFDSDKVYVYTSLNHVAEKVADVLGAKVFLSDRISLRCDTPEIDAAQDFLRQNAEVDRVAIIPSASVLLQPHHLTAACRLIGEGCDSVVCVSRHDETRWRPAENGTDDTAVDSSDHEAPQGTLLGPVVEPEGGDLQENGLFFCATRDVIMNGRVHGERVGQVEIEPKYTPNLNLNDECDWTLMEQRVMRIGCMDQDSLVPARLVVFSGDSVITDNQVYDGTQGIRFSSYNLRDVAGIQMLLERGIEVMIIEETANMVINKFAEKVGVPTVPCGEKRTEVIDAWRRERGLRWNRVAFMGSDCAGDLDCLRLVKGHGAVPSDAGPEARRTATFISSKAGGRGAVGEFCNFLIALMDRISAEIEEAAHIGFGV